MKKRFGSIVLAGVLGFALILGLGSIDSAKALSGASGEHISLPAGESNLFATDEAGNSLVRRDTDSATTKFAPDTYGLHGTLRP